MESRKQIKLMKQAVSEASQHSRELQQMCSTISSHFQAGNDGEAVQQLQILLQGIGYISQAIQLTTPLQEESGTKMDLGEMPIVLQPLVEALENKDYGLAGEVLGHEVEPILGKWSGQLGQLSEAV